MACLLPKISTSLLTLTILVKLVGIVWLKSQIASIDKEYSYVGDDYPETWPIPRKSVLLQFDNPHHFNLHKEDGIAEWGALSPENGVIHLGPRRQPFTVAMLHQLKCMDVIRDEMVRDRSEGYYEGPTALGRHCLNYIRQIIMCHGDLELEKFQFASHKNPIDWRGVYECKDWETVFNEVTLNQREHKEWVKA